MNRFSEPTLREQIAAEWCDCDQCGQRTHYEELNDDNVCRACVQLNKEQKNDCTNNQCVTE